MDTQFRGAFFTAIVQDMERRGCTEEEIVSELERISGNPVDVHEACGERSFTIHIDS